MKSIYKKQDGSHIELTEQEYNAYPKNIHLTLIGKAKLVIPDSSKKKTKKNSEE